LIEDTLDSLAIVVVNYGSSALLAHNLVPIAREIGAHVVVVDNFTDDAERARVVEIAAREGWSAVLPAGNTGFGGGINLGVARAREGGSTRYLLLNPDASIGLADVATMLRRSVAAPLALLSPRVLRPDGSVWFDGADLYLHDGRIRSPRRRQSLAPKPWEPWLSGACLMVTDLLWQTVGGFDDSYFLYWEDVDLSHRVLAAGGTLELCADATAVHDEGGTQGRHGAAKSSNYYFYNIRNRMLFAVRNLSADDVRRWRRLIVPIAREVLLQGGRRQFAQSVDPWVAGARGVLAARRVAREYTSGSRAR
jgi:GT2 family glycosyltransferase